MHTQAPWTEPQQNCLTLSLSDCRKVRRRQEAPRWVDSYTVPGQFVGIRYPPDPVSDSADMASSTAEGMLSPASLQMPHWDDFVLQQLLSPQDLTCSAMGVWLSAGHSRDARSAVCTQTCTLLQPLSSAMCSGIQLQSIATIADVDASASAAGAASTLSSDEVPTARTLFAISSSPYSARRESANLDASIIEVGMCFCMVAVKPLLCQSAYTSRDNCPSAVVHEHAQVHPWEPLARCLPCSSCQIPLKCHHKNCVNSKAVIKI